MGKKSKYEITIVFVVFTDSDEHYYKLLVK